jgi:hypothetical protein
MTAAPASRFLCRRVGCHWVAMLVLALGGGACRQMGASDCAGGEAMGRGVCRQLQGLLRELAPWSQLMSRTHATNLCHELMPRTHVTNSCHHQSSCHTLRWGHFSLKRAGCRLSPHAGAAVRSPLRHPLHLWGGGTLHVGVRRCPPLGLGPSDSGARRPVPGRSAGSVHHPY